MTILLFKEMDVNLDDRGTWNITILYNKEEKLN